MKNILVSGASGVVGYGILRSLRMSSEEYNLVGTSIYKDSVAPAFCDTFEQAPLTNSDTYVPWLIQTIQKHKIDMLIPGIEIDMITWNEIRDQIEETGAKVMLNSQGLIELCSDKWNFYQRVVQDCPELLIRTRLDGEFSELQEEYGLPFLLKPRKGFASKGIVTVDSEEVFNSHRHELGDKLMAQPVVGDKDQEYTVSAFFDDNSNLLCSMSLKRTLAKEGYTEKAEVTELKGAKEAILALSKILKPVGPTNFQFRVEGSQPKLLEINPRISSATAIRAAFGYNESAMSIEYFLNHQPPNQPSIKTGFAVRYIEEHIFYDRNTV